MQQHPRLDKKDLRIIYELGVNGRCPLAQIAKKAGLSRQNAHYRLNRLIREGVIRKFITFIDFPGLGYYSYDFWISLRVISKKRRQELIASFLKHPNAIWVSEYVGRWDVCVAIVARNVGHFYKLFNAILGGFSDIIRDYLVMSTVEAVWYSRSHIAGESAPRKVLGAWRSDIEIVSLGLEEKKILEQISEDARQPIQALARRLGMDPATASRKIRKLEQSGIIQSYQALVDMGCLGLSRFELLLSLRGMTIENEKALKEFCFSNPYVFLYLKNVGRWDADIGIEARNTIHLQEIISELREKFPDVIVDYEVLPIAKEHRQKSFPGTLL